MHQIKTDLFGEETSCVFCCSLRNRVAQRDEEEVERVEEERTKREKEVDTLLLNPSIELFSIIIINYFK